jgi:hypothetical protein
MATLWIREYNLKGDAGAGKAPIAKEPGADQTVTFTTTTQSAAFAANTQFIAIIGSAAFHYVVGSNPTATTGGLKVPADTLLYIGVTGGHKIAAVTAA